MTVEEEYMSYRRALWVAIKSSSCNLCGAQIMILPKVNWSKKIIGYQLYCSRCLGRQDDPLSLCCAARNAEQTVESRLFSMPFGLKEQDRIGQFWLYTHIPILSRQDVDFYSCWTWMRSTDKKGYGWFRGNARVYRANRFAYAISYPNTPQIDDLIVRHRCDNPGCCNPFHLLPGTNSDNMRDMYLRNRQGGRTMNLAKVNQLLRDHETGVSVKQLAKHFHIGEWQVLAILRGYSWWFVDGRNEERPVPRK